MSLILLVVGIAVTFGVYRFGYRNGEKGWKEGYSNLAKILDRMEADKYEAQNELIRAGLREPPTPTATCHQGWIDHINEVTDG